MELNRVLQSITNDLGERPPEDCHTDGRTFTRFGYKKRLWALIGFTGKGKPWAAYGDWSTGSSYKWAEAEGFFKSQEYQTTIKKIEAEKKKAHEPILAYLKGFFQNIIEKKTAVGHLYQKRKRIPQHKDIITNEALTYTPYEYNPQEGIVEPIKDSLRTVDGKALVIALRNIKGQITGIQTIDEKGNKMFVKGSIIKESFLCFGDLAKSDYVYLAEGIGTAGSIQTAVDGLRASCTVCAFNCHNMSNVAHIIRREHPTSKIILCEDYDDAGMSTHVEKQLNNVIIKRPPKEGQDFADLVTERAREILRIREEDFVDIRAVDMTGKSYVFYSSWKKGVTECGINIPRSHIEDLAPVDWWLKSFPNKDNTDLEAAQCRNYLKKLARDDDSMLDGARLRGSGYFLQQPHKKSGPLYHQSMGVTRFKTDENKVHIKGKKIYTPNPISPDDLSWLRENVQEIAELSTQFCWSNPDYGKYLLGWLLTAPFCGCLPFRPHIWITGNSSSGKSWIVDNFAAPLLLDSCVKEQGASSEAGIRQELRDDSLPIILDEFETENLIERTKRSYILEILRCASATIDATITKGTADGRSRKFKICTSALLASVRSSLTFEANRNRFIQLSLESLKQRDQSFDVIAEKLSKERLTRVGQLNIDNIFFNFDKFYELYTDWYGSLRGRLNDHLNRCYAVVGAGIEMYGVEVDRMNVVNDIRKALDLVTTEEEECLNHLIRYEAKFQGQPHGTILEICQEMLTPEVYGNLDGSKRRSYLALVLRTNGVNFCVDDHRLQIFFKHPKVIEVMKTFPDTNWMRTLIRMKGSKITKTGYRRGKSFILSGKCIEIMNFLQNDEKESTNNFYNIK